MPLFITGALIIVGLVSAVLFALAVPLAVGLLVYDILDSYRRGLAERSIETLAAETTVAHNAATAGEMRRIPA